MRAAAESSNDPSIAAAGPFVPLAHSRRRSRVGVRQSNRVEVPRNRWHRPSRGRAWLVVSENTEGWISVACAVATPFFHSHPEARLDSNVHLTGQEYPL